MWSGRSPAKASAGRFCRVARTAHPKRAIAERGRQKPVAARQSGTLASQRSNRKTALPTKDRATTTCIPPGVLSPTKWPRTPHANRPEPAMPDRKSNKGQRSIERDSNNLCSRTDGELDLIEAQKSPLGNGI